MASASTHTVNISTTTTITTTTGTMTSAVMLSSIVAGMPPGVFLMVESNKLVKISSWWNTFCGFMCHPITWTLGKSIVSVNMCFILAFQGDCDSTFFCSDLILRIFKIMTSNVNELLEKLTKAQEKTQEQIALLHQEVTHSRRTYEACRVKTGWQKETLL